MRAVATAHAERRSCSLTNGTEEHGSEPPSNHTLLSQRVPLNRHCVRQRRA
jgi:hypothetical protein